MKVLNPNYMLIILIALSHPAVAEEVFKCKQPDGDILYQPTPCPPGDATKEVLKIQEMTPQQVEAAKAKLKAEEEKEAANDAAKAQAEQQRQMEIDKQRALEMERQRLAAQQRAAAEAERRRTWGSTYMPPYYRNQNGDM